MNFKHGHYSKNPSLNPDSVLMSNIEVKRALMEFECDIKDVLDGKVVKAGIFDLVCRLIDCVMPHSEHLLPKTHLDAAYEFYRTRSFEVVTKSNKNKSLKELIAVVKFFAN